jgi:hypothetical protein
MPITAIVLSNFRDIACSLSLVPLPSFYRWLGQEHGRTIPLAGFGCRSLAAETATARKWQEILRSGLPKESRLESTAPLLLEYEAMSGLGCRGKSDPAVQQFKNN